MLGMALFALCLFVAFLAVCVVLTLAPDQYLKSARVVVCPETRQSAPVKVNVFERIMTFLRGCERLELKECSRWPERRDCGQECLLQVDSSPELLNRLLRRWYGSKECVLCHRALVEDDWRLGHYSALDAGGKFLTAAEIAVSELHMLMDTLRPVCWSCHQVEAARRPPQIFAGDRRERYQEMWMGQ
jgi:hypothetical protein